MTSDLPIATSITLCAFNKFYRYSSMLMVQSFCLQGLLALTRQWKNVLYMPVETTFKSKRKVQNLAVTFRIPNEDSVENFEVLIQDLVNICSNSAPKLTFTSNSHAGCNKWMPPGCELGSQFVWSGGKIGKMHTLQVYSMKNRTKGSKFFGT